MNAPGALTCDIAIAGGGLAGSLIALALHRLRPDLDVRLIEGETHLGGNHIWSFFDSDIAADHRWLVDPLIVHRWQGYDVRFPGHIRTLDATYNSIESERLDAVVRATLNPARIMQGRCVDVKPRSITLDTQQRVSARHVIDARGPADLSLLDLGWQKFMGQKLRIKGGHGLTRPIVMDATVAQIDGYRFVYVLPFSADELFIEDTYYSDGAALPLPELRQRIADYAAVQGWTIDAVLREETGVLPVAMGGDFDAYWHSGGESAKAGMRAALFHPLTGYSLPDAVALAVHLAEELSEVDTNIAALTRDWARERWTQRGYYRMLTTMLFRAADGPDRYRILERFYRLSPGLIGRFYAGQSTVFDKMRILSGKPPVPIGRAIKALTSQYKKGRTA